MVQNDSFQDLREMKFSVVDYNKGVINIKQLMTVVNKLKSHVGEGNHDVINQPWIRALDLLHDEQTKFAIFEDICNFDSSLLKIVISCSYPTRISTFILEVKSSDTVDDVKAKICKKTGTLPGEQRLFYNIKLLEENQPLSDFGIQNGAQFRVERYLKVIFKFIDGARFSMDVGDFQTIEAIKMDIIFKSVLKPFWPNHVDDVKLVYDGKRLHDGLGQRVMDYNIQSGDIIYIIFRMPLEFFNPAI